jgi:polyferredoxin
MSGAIALAAGCVWLIVANVTAMFPSKDYHWSNAYKLIAVGLPILVWIAWANGLIWAAGFLIAAGSVLRWPLVYLGRWLRKFLT